MEATSEISSGEKWLTVKNDEVPSIFFDDERSRHTSIGSYRPHKLSHKRGAALFGFAGFIGYMEERTRTDGKVIRVNKKQV